MAVVGNIVVHAVISAADYELLETKSPDTLYFVTGSGGITLYKGDTPVGSSGGFSVLSANPIDTTGMVEGTLYLAPNGKMYYRSGSTLGVAFDLRNTADDTAQGNDKAVPSVTAMYSAIAAKIAAAMSGTYRSSVLAPVADITALKAVTGMHDKDICFVEAVNSIYSYDAESSAIADDSSVVAPTGGVGRWLKTSAGFAYSSTDFTWGQDGLELAVRMPANPTDGQLLAWDGTNGVLKWTPMVDAYTKAETNALLAGKASVSDISWNVITPSGAEEP